MNNVKILRLDEVIYLTGLSRSTIYLKMSQNDFPKQISLGARAVGWLSSDIGEWLNDRIFESKRS